MNNEDKELLLKDLCARFANGHYDSTMTYKSFDRLNAHHFNYRGLIFIEVTEENNPYKE